MIPYIEGRLQTGKTETWVFVQSNHGKLRNNTCHACVLPGRGYLKPTETTSPDYFHKVVDCQWACPAHTNVPEYIRLIAQGRYTDAYMVNRESNVFPAILGRTCDRPCEPACRRTRVDGNPVAICRLKRVAADLRGEISGRLPRIPATKHGKRVACIRAG